MALPNTISQQKPVRLVGTSPGPVLLNLRPLADRQAEPRSIPGSGSRAWDQVADWGEALRRSCAVVICRDGRAHSHGAAAWLRTQGVAAEALEGGASDWSAAERPMVPLDKLRNRDAQGRTVCVTGSRPTVDRIACPWLIRRFIDPDEVFLFVPPSDVAEIAERLDGEAFDIDDAGIFWSHRGELRTFDVMVQERGLATEPLPRLARLVRGADTGRADLAPEAAGLLAASLGPSRIYADDLEQLDAGMLLYDAFHRSCRDASDETDDWPADKPKART